MKNWGTGTRILSDGVTQRKIMTHAHEPGIVTSVLEQPNRGIILERNKQIRDNKLEKDLSFGRHVACVPIADLERLRKETPDLNAKDGKIRQAAWAKILKDPANKKYLVVEKY